MIDLKKLADNLTNEKIIELVTKLGSDEYQDTEKAIIFKTICHNVDATEASMKLYYYKDSKKFHCFTECGETFNIYTLFEKRYKLLGKEYNFYTDIVQIIAEGAEVEDFSNSFFYKYESNFDKFEKQKIEVNLKPINPSILDIYSFYPTVEWLNDGINEQSMKDFNIKYSIDENKIIIPHYDIDNNLVGIRCRPLNEEDLIIGKYMPVQIEGKMYSHPLGYNLYGLNIVKENIKRFQMAIIGEGEKAVLQYNTMFGLKNNICIAACGSSISNYQIELLIKSGAKKILIAFDKEGDSWQEKQNYYNKLLDFCKKFQNKVQMGFIWDTKNLLKLKESPFDKGKEIFIKLYKGAKWI